MDWDEMTDAARAFKADCLGRPPGWMPPLLFAERGGRLFARVAAGEVDRDLGLRAANTLRLGASADRITAYFDTFTKEVDGPDAALGKGELQRDVEAGRGAGISQAVISVRAAAGGPLLAANLPYAVRGGRLWWAEPERLPADVTGDVPAALAWIMAEPCGFAAIAGLTVAPARVRAELLRVGAQLDPAERLERETNATLEALRRRGFAVRDCRPDRRTQDN